MLSQNSSDFIIGSNGHAGLSNRKAAELLKTSHTTVNRAIESGTVFTESETQMITVSGFQGGTLVKLAEMLAKSNQVKPETREHCFNFLTKAATIGAQTFLDQLAGISLQQPQPQPQLAFDTQVRVEVDLIREVLSFAGLDNKLTAGVMLNHAGYRLPEMRQAVNEAHSLLAASAPSELLMTPTAIGQELGISARQVNLLLLDIGYQVKNLSKSKDAPAYLPTDIGQPYATNTLATGKLYESGADNTTYQHLKWKSQVVEILREQMVEV
jgi:hypothetical protein